MLDRLAATMVHRGPDGTGRFHSPCGSTALSSQRLSIIDLRSGDQPVRNEDGSVHCVFNGEIVNHLELRRDLVTRGHSFRSRGDSEVIAHSYEEFGVDFVAKFVGMFAVAVWDQRRRQLVLARDRYGIKPLYYLWHDGVLAFASEIKALCRLPWYRAEVNPAALVDYTALQHTLGDHTFFRNVYRLPPGHRLTLRLGDRSLPRSEEYWHLSLDDAEVEHDRGEESFREEVRHVISDAVRLHVRSDVAVGSHLSGGLDSSTVATLAAAHLPRRLRTFSGGFDVAGFDESRYALSVADHIGSEHLTTYPRPAELAEHLPGLVRLMDEPAAGPGLFPQYMVSRLAAPHVKVVLSGLGGDEVAGGYVRYFAAAVDRALRGAVHGTGDAGALVELSGQLGQLRGYEGMLGALWSSGPFASDAHRYYHLVRRSDPRAVLEREFLDHARRDPFEPFAEIFNRPKTDSCLNRMLYADSQGSLPALLHVEDRVSMAVSIESRVPLLDHRIAETFARVPPGLKNKGGELRSLYRSAVSDLLPGEVAVRRDKMGFPVPMATWFGGPLRDFVTDVLGDGSARSRGVLRPALLTQLVAHPERFGREVWGALCLELWFRAFIDRDPTSPAEGVR